VSKSGEKVFTESLKFLTSQTTTGKTCEKRECECNICLMQERVGCEGVCV